MLAEALSGGQGFLTRTPGRAYDVARTGIMSLASDTWIADLHIHSRYSRATSRDLTPERLAASAAVKGVRLLGCGDLTHSAWLAELKERLDPARPDGAGLYRLAGQGGPAGEVLFLLSGEISCIYKKNDRVRKVHVVVLLPSFEAAERFNERLGRVGNLASDGRPILGLDAKEVLNLVLETDPLAELFPAHIWTPWFSVLGSKSGFESVEECFEELSGHIHAAETGLSSDPPMNWRVSSLDRFQLVSSSDAHSPAKIGREATLFSCGLSYPEIIQALRTGQGLKGTLEFFPEEGKYHLDGHRRCQIRLSPEETRSWQGLCPACGRPVTVGVLNRVEALADRSPGRSPSGAKPFERLLALDQVLGQVLGLGPGSKKVAALQDRLQDRLGPELFILRQAPLEDIDRAGGPVLAEAVARVRQGKVRALAGYDGEFGTLSLFTPQELAELNRQKSLFGLAPGGESPARTRPSPAARPAREPEELFEPAAGPLRDEDQETAVSAAAGPLAVVAGPGSGKTGVLTRRVLHFLDQGASPERVLALTFTRKAAEELAGRLARQGGEPGRRVWAGTFHALGQSLLAEWGLKREVLDEAERLALIRPLAKTQGLRPAQAADLIARAKLTPAWDSAICPPELLAAYQAALEAEGRWDFEDLLLRPLALARQDQALARAAAARFDHLLVDEFQDLNPVQFAWLDLLVPEPERSLTVVGDPDQAIYGFRGASPLFFNRLAQARPGLRLIELRTSYRVPGPILEAAASVIGPNPGRHLPLRPARARGARLSRAGLVSPPAEAVFVVQQIERLIGGSSHLAQQRGGLDGGVDYALGEVAVLFRLHRQAAEIAAALDRAGLPCQIAAEAPGRETDQLDLAADKISLLTFHAAKGLEFPVVFLVGLEENLLPYRPPGGAADWEEERRLFYVALTRARDQVVLSHCRQRVLFGRKARPGPSPFLQDIPERLLEKIKSSPLRPRQIQPALF